MSAWREAFAPAKVNLWLEVLGRRPDGFHELDTLMLALELGDRVRARRRDEPGVELRVDGPAASADIPADARNLAHRAAAAVLAASGVAGGLELELEKRVPSGSGLGGASSDAAAALLAAEAALAVELPPAERRALLAGLGSDCVFFLDAAASGLARCRGRGEEVEPWPPPPAGWWLALLTPALACPTAEIYRAHARLLCGGPTASSLPAAWRAPGLDPKASIDELRRLTFNRLQEAALVAVPDLRNWKEMLARDGSPGWSLSGSGSSFFALFPTREEAAAVLARAVDALARAGLEPRLATLVRPSGKGACLVG